jgi:hypothetical protein
VRARARLGDEDLALSGPPAIPLKMTSLSVSVSVPGSKSVSTAVSGPDTLSKTKRSAPAPPVRRVVTAATVERVAPYWFRGRRPTS